MSIDLNCDMGEGLSNDALIMPYINSANIACGYHAGNEQIMRETIDTALLYNVAVGAHPGFNDRQNFGRTEIQLQPDELYDLVAEQIFILTKIANEAGAKLKHVKPHGALYNMSAKDPSLAAIIAKAVADADKELKLFGLSGSCSLVEAKKLGLETVAEVFADRTYQDDGSLTPRSMPNALIVDESESVSQVLQMVNEGTVKSVNGNIVKIAAETICLHGDGKHAVEFAKRIYEEVFCR